MIILRKKAFVIDPGLNKVVVNKYSCLSYMDDRGRFYVFLARSAAPSGGGRDEYEVSISSYGINTSLGIPMVINYSYSAFNNGQGASAGNRVSSFYELIARAKLVSEDVYERLKGIDESNREKYVSADSDIKPLLNNKQDL